MYYSLKTVPVRLETLGQFTASNPWNRNPAEKWTLGLYALISESYAPSLKWKQMRKEQAETAGAATRRRAVQDRKLKNGPDHRLRIIRRSSALAWLAINPLKIRRKLAAIGAQPIPVEVTFVRVSTPPNSKSANIFYSWVDASGRSLTASTEFRGTRDPFWLDAAKTKMLALTAPDGQAHLLDAALASVSLSNAERSRVIAARDR